MAASDAGFERSQLVHFLDLGKLGLFFVCMPVLNPHEEAFVFVIHHAVDLPVECGKPDQFHRVELMHRNAADFGPRSVLEGVVVEELAAQ